jgi:hypothetical protein
MYDNQFNIKNNNLSTASLCMQCYYTERLLCYMSWALVRQFKPGRCVLSNGVKINRAFVFWCLKGTVFMSFGQSIFHPGSEWKRITSSEFDNKTNIW